MLYLASFREITSLLLDAPDAEAAAEKCLTEVGEAPARLHEVPPGMLALEVHMADPEGSEDPDNAANVAATGMSLEPFEEFAEWLDDVDADDAEDLDAEETDA